MHEIVIYYRYTRVKDPAGFVAWQKEICTRLGLKGRILIAREGINGTVEGTSDNIAEYEDAMRSYYVKEKFADLRDLWFKHSPGTGKAFPRLSARVRDEIVTLGLPKEKDIDPNEITGTHLKPEELKRWIESGEEFEIIDMRNDYEYAVGHFKGSINPMLENFRDLKDKVAELAPLKKKKVLTVCTYGVRCEKASGYLKSQGFEDVYQLDGGIGTYMKAYPGQDFLGSLYVFDERVTEVFTDQYEKVGRCTLCSATTENCHNCSNLQCHRQMLVCDSCYEGTNAWCSAACKQKTLESSPAALQN